ncbi:unnamed protein product, partial [Nippostrongylus brasiliensis]|uniref:Outer capsid protein VP2 n=1 Tax=Nippostrongylus brasiliensis TaxID=27835 RepID=A0A0N4YYE8_NIPBR
RYDFKKANYGRIGTYLDYIDWIGSFLCAKDVDEMTPICEAKLPGYLERLYLAKVDSYREAMLQSTDENWYLYKEISDNSDKRLKKFNRSIEKKILESGNQPSFHKFINFKLKSKKPLTLYRDDGPPVVTDAVNETEEESVPMTASNFPRMIDSLWFILNQKLRMGFRLCSLKKYCSHFKAFGILIQFNFLSFGGAQDVDTFTGDTNTKKDPL